jgi:hypothetical protein
LADCLLERAIVLARLGFPAPLERAPGGTSHASTSSMLTLRFAAVPLLAGLILVACTQEGPTRNARAPSPGTAVPEGVTNAQDQADLQLVDRIATARCNRAQACNDIGNGKMYLSRQLCQEQIRGNSANDVTGYNCPHGVDKVALDRCMQAIDVSPCGKSTEKLSDIAECKTDALCLK